MKVQVFLSMGLSGCKKEDIIEIDDDELADCETQKEKDELIEQYTKDWFWNEIDFGYEEV